MKDTQIAKDVTELVGRTPLIQINHLAVECSECGSKPARVLAKVESRNPGGSIKDRPALAIIRAAEASGALQPGGTIVEATSGNTGVALAMVGAALGYKVVIAMPSSMSIERRKLMAIYGAELLLSEPANGMVGAKAAAEKYLAEHEGSVYASQFANPANPNIHESTTGPEIWAQSGEDVDIFVAGVGSAGTIAGAGKYLKSVNPELKVVAVEPVESPLLGEGKAGPHKIQGIGANFVPDNYNPRVVDEILTVASDDAVAAAREAARKEGLLVGISSGANLVAAKVLASRPENAGKTIVTVLPDTGERYLSTVLFEGIGE